MHFRLAAECRICAHRFPPITPWDCRLGNLQPPPETLPEPPREGEFSAGGLWKGGAGAGGSPAAVLQHCDPVTQLRTGLDRETLEARCRCRDLANKPAGPGQVACLRGTGSTAPAAWQTCPPRCGEGGGAEQPQPGQTWLGRGKPAAPRLGCSEGVFPRLWRILQKNQNQPSSEVQVCGQAGLPS